METEQSKLSKRTIPNLLVMQLIVGVIGFLNVIVVGKFLSPAQYAAFAFILSVYSIFNLLLSPIRTVVGKEVPELYASGRLDKIKTIVSGAGKIIAGFILLLLLMLAFGGHHIARFFKLQDPTLLWAAAVLIGVGLSLDIFRGLANAKLDFRQYIRIFYLEAFLRLLCTLALTRTLLNSLTATASYVFSTGIALVWALSQNQDVLKADSYRLSRKIELSRFTPVFLYSVLAVGFHAGDMFMAKHLLPPQEAGYYGAATQISKIFTIVGVAFTAYMFPLTVLNAGRFRPVLRQILASAAGFLALAAMGLAGFYLIKDRFIILMLKPDFLPAGSTALILSCAMSLLIVSQLMSQLFLALNKSGILLILIALVAVEYLVMYRIGDTGEKIALIHLTTIGAGLLLSSLALVGLKLRKEVC